MEINLFLKQLLESKQSTEQTTNNQAATEQSVSVFSNLSKSEATELFDYLDTDHNKVMSQSELDSASNALSSVNASISELKNLFSGFGFKTEEEAATEEEPIQTPVDTENEKSIFTNFDNVDTASLVNVSQDDFLKKSQEDNNFWKNINNAGSENIFSLLDTDGDKMLNEGELSALSSFDNTAENISTDDLKNFFINNNINIEIPSDEETAPLEETTPPEETTTTPTQETTPPEETASLEEMAPTEDAPTTSTSSQTPDAGAATPQGATIEEQIKDLEENVIPATQQNVTDIKTKADEDVKLEEEALNDAIQKDAKISTELKEKYKDVNSKITEKQTQIREKETAITDKGNEIDNVSNDISQKESELSSISSDSDDTETQNNIEERKSTLQTEIGRLNEKKTELEKEKAKLEEEKTTLEGDKTELEKEKAEVMSEIQKQASTETKTVITEKQKNIQDIKETATEDTKAAEDTVNQAKTLLTTLKQEVGQKQGRLTGTTKGGVEFASIAKQVAEGMNSEGKCLTGVSEAVFQKYGFNLGYSDAYLALPEMKKRPEFNEVVVGKDELTKLPAGAVVVWKKSDSHPSGHISVALGDGQEASDHVGPQITNLTPEYHVFLPVE